MSSSVSNSGFLPLPMPGTSAWRTRIAAIFSSTNTHVLLAFWLFGLINNVLYVVILSSAQDLVGSLPKGIVLIADVLPSFITKLVAPYFIHRVPYSLRILIFCALSTAGMLLISLTPSTQTVAVKLVGVVLASLSSGGGELSFLGLTHYYGPMSLAAWGSGTGGAGLVGAGLYVMFTSWFGFSVKGTLLASASLPIVMLLSFFVILPQGPLRQGIRLKGYESLPEEDLIARDVEDDPTTGTSSSSLLAPGPDVTATAFSARPERYDGTFLAHLSRFKLLLVPYVLPLLMVYIAEYTINQGVASTLLFPSDSGPFSEHRSYYPFYNFLYQVGVFISRSSTPFIRIHHLYLPSILQVANLILLTLHSLFFFIPSVYIIFAVVFWEGLLGGAVYVNVFAEIHSNVQEADREFSLSATSVSDSAGICIAGFVGIALETWLCNWNVQHGRPWCKDIEVS